MITDDVDLWARDFVASETGLLDTCDKGRVIGVARSVSWHAPMAEQEFFDSIETNGARLLKVRVGNFGYGLATRPVAWGR